MIILEEVSLLGCRDYDPETLDSVIEGHFKNIDPQNKTIKQGSVVVIKPNLVVRRDPKEAATTDPEFVGAIIRAVKRRGGEPVIAESPGGPYNAVSLRSIYAGCGMERVAKRDGAELNFDLGSTEVSCEGKVCRSVQIIDPLLRADVIISAAKLKTHEMMTYTGAVKNMFGAVPGLMKPEMHYRYPNKRDFAQMIVDICERVRPTISFIDAVDCMEGNGPTAGHKKHMGVTLASLSPYDTDLLGSRLAGFMPDEVPVVAAAVERELCPQNVSGLKILGDRPERFLSDFVKPDSASVDISEMLPKFLRGAVSRMFSARPRVNTDVCVGCGRCAESCPGKTIKIVAGKAKIDYSGCIACFCCHELCPQKAIDVKKSVLGRF